MDDFTGLCIGGKMDGEVLVSSSESYPVVEAGAVVTRYYPEKIYFDVLDEDCCFCIWRHESIEDKKEVIIILLGKYHGLKQEMEDWNLGEAAS